MVEDSMILRSVLALTLVVLGALISGCTQPTPSAPSLVALPSASPGQFTAVTVNASSVSQFLAQLTNVNTFVTSANWQLTQYTSGPPVPQSPGAPLDEHCLEFYLKANALLDAAASLAPDPLPTKATELLNTILEQANQTQPLIAGAVARGRLSELYDEITTQALHTIEVVNGLLAP
jgi:hypothetical protein